MIYVFADGKRILTTNVNSATVTIMEKTEGRAGGPPLAWADRPLECRRGHRPHRRAGLEVDGDSCRTRAGGVRCFSDGKEAWVANAQDGTISIIDIAQKKVTATLAANVPGANRLKLRRMGSWCWLHRGRAGDSGRGDT